MVTINCVLAHKTRAHGLMYM